MKNWYKFFLCKHSKHSKPYKKQSRFHNIPSIFLGINSSTINIELRWYDTKLLESKILDLWYDNLISKDVCFNIIGIIKSDDIVDRLPHTYGSIHFVDDRFKSIIHVYNKEGIQHTDPLSIQI